MKKILLAFGLMLFASPVFAADLKVAFGDVGNDVKVMREHFAEFTKKTGHTVSIVPMPTSTTDQFGQYKLWLSAKNQGIDLYMVDVIWAPQLAEHFVDLKDAAKNVVADHFPSVIASQTVNGRLVAMPYFTDAPMLYYRKDLLDKYKKSVPTTWAELEQTSKDILAGEQKAGNTKLTGFVFQGKAYEGLTCDALEWINSFGGGQIVEPDGTISINNPNAVSALTTVKGWIGTIAPQGVLSYQEEESRGVFQSGNAIFMRNWPYAYSLAQGADSPVKGKVGVTNLPKGPGAAGKSAATLGGWNVAVSNYSQIKSEAVQLALFLASKEIQKANAIKSSHFPTIPSLYQDKEVLAVAPFFAPMLEVLKNSVARPSAPTKRKYNEVSKLFWTQVQSAISGNRPPAEALKTLDGQLTRLKGKGW